jgi:hypothetical protein
MARAKDRSGERQRNESVKSGAAVSLELFRWACAAKLPALTYLLRWVGCEVVVVKPQAEEASPGPHCFAPRGGRAVTPAAGVGLMIHPLNQVSLSTVVRAGSLERRRAKGR